MNKKPLLMIGSNMRKVNIGFCGVFRSTIRQKERKYFSKYPLDLKEIVLDGVVEEGSYLASKIKILFLLKEPKSPGQGGWSLIDKIRSYEPVPMLDTLARWTVGIRNLPADIPWKVIKEISAYTRICALNDVVLFNLKKTPGDGTTNEENLEHYAIEHSHLIKMQFHFYNCMSSKSIGQN